MDVVTREHIAPLVETERAPSLSIFLPTHRAGPDSRPYAQEDVIRWKNLLREAGTRLHAAGLAARHAEAILGPGHALIEDIDFWQHQSDGLAVFAAEGLFYTFRVPLRLDPMVVVEPRFHVTPLLPLLGGQGLFYILALSQHAVRLLQATRQAVSEVDLTTAPKSLQEALRFDEPEKQLQFHTGTPGRPRGRRSAVFHGHGVGTDDSKDNILRFCQQVDRGLHGLFRNGSSPLLLAAVEYVAAIYRQANTHAHLVEPILQGNPEDKSAAELHERAWPLVEPYLTRARDAALERYRDLRGKDRTTGDLGAALRAAEDGQVDTLFVASGAQSWGAIDAATRELTLHDDAGQGGEELLNTAAVRTFRGGGMVHVLEPDEMPGGGPIAALLRY